MCIAEKKLFILTMFYEWIIVSFLKKNIAIWEAVWVLIQLTNTPTWAITQASPWDLCCFVILWMDLEYDKRNTNFLFHFWLLAHKSHIAGWIAAEADSEIILSVRDIY